MATEKRLIDANAKFIEKHFAKRLIDGYALVDVIENIDWYHIGSQGNLEHGANSQLHTPLFKAPDIFQALANAPTVDAVPVSAEELRHLINDTLAYIRKMESDGRENLTESRKTLLEKLKRFEKEHFPEIACSYGERKDNVL